MSLFAIVGVVGLAVEYSNATRVRALLSSAADAAALAAAREPSTSYDKRSEAAEKVFRAALADKSGMDGVRMKLSVLENSRIRVTADTDVNTILLGILGISSVNVDTLSEVQQVAEASRDIEFSIVFDITNSVVFDASGYQQAIVALKELVDKMFANTSVQVIGNLIPFSDRVRVGPVLSGVATGPAPKNWGGCLDVREQVVGGKKVLTDDPSSTAPLSYFTPQNKTSPFFKGMSYTFGCFGAPAIFAQQSKASIVSGLDTMGAGGTGRLDEGMVWAFRSLSPRWRGQFGRAGYPADYGATDKIAIFISDGRTEAYRYEMVPPSGPPTIIGFNEGSVEGFKAFVNVCEQMRKQGINVFVIQLNGNPGASTYFRDCAGSPERYFTVGNVVQFKNALSKVSVQQASALRIVR